MKKVIIAVFAIMMLASTAMAADNLDRCYYSMDNNGDSVLSKEEFKKALPESDKAFSAADVDKSGDLDHDEWESYKKSIGIEENHG
ncbi:EF-hand domain-containing protein [Maridesulfovibrio frigidus]|uniref:hypothetical protein n=1 Tax=Maridesulfovibrio frigidus TaxID=340956 RepID=UPI00069087D6|nr:hypothetical protein [Maridesulfovibrio frigidus]